MFPASSVESPPAESSGLLLPLACLPVPAACFELADNPRLLSANSCFHAWFGLADQPQPRLGCWLERTYPNADYRGRVLQQWRSAASQARAGGVGSLRCRLLNAENAPLEVLLQIACHQEMLVVVFQDLTARSQAEAELEEARATLAEAALAITEAIPVGTYTMVMPPDRPVAYFSFLSERFLEISGLDRARARQNPLEVFACVHPDDYDEWLRINAEAFAGRRPFKGECRVVVRGETRWISAESVPRDLPDGSTVWEGVLIDISERVKVQQQLQESEQRLRRLLDNLPIPVTTGRLSEAGEVYSALFCNRRFEETLGYSQADLEDLDGWLARAYPDPGYRAVVQQRWGEALAEAASSGRAVTAGEFRLRCADGRDLDVLISAATIDDFVAATLVDLSERKRDERALAEARLRERRLEEQQRQRLEQKLRTSLAAAAVAHEINQPLSAILLQAHLARDGLLRAGDPCSQADLAELAALLEAQVGEAERVVRVVEKMRSLLRNVNTDPQPVDLANVVESALLFQRNKLEASGVELLCGGVERPCPILGDSDQLQVAIANLLRNALEALESVPPGQRRLAVNLERGEQKVALSVADSGTGFGAGVLEALPLTTTKPDGTGLGLFVVQTTAENHGGSLRFDRCPQLGGARVRLELPSPPPQVAAGSG